MNKEKQTAAGDVLRIEGEMTIYRALELKELLFPAARKVDTFVLDLSGVTDIDTSGVQLLLLAQRAAAGAGAEFEIRAPSAATREVLGLLGLGQLCADAGVVQ